jgi:hypothetical protein
MNTRKFLRYKILATSFFQAKTIIYTVFIDPLSKNSTILQFTSMFSISIEKYRLYNLRFKAMELTAIRVSCEISVKRLFQGSVLW